MGNRYGRNQRRRHRAEIARLTEAKRLETQIRLSLAEQLKQLRDDFQRWDDEIVRLLGAYSAFRRKTPVVEVTHPIRELPVYERASRISVSPFADVTRGDVAYMRERMHAFLMELRKDEFSRSVMFRLIERDRRTGDVAYVISDTLLAASGLGPLEIRHIAESIAAFFNEKERKHAPARTPANARDILAE